ncbi:ribosomal RNA-processing protein 8 [Anopheles gambiae]|uniref:ribosomal RNA-processing protein 8 n=1 Tax=Anopheles gambiae TaxID=7165 RepID=UPI002AC8E5B3|nr:ribosomal RNA-processing protein 8 [Anopheles gambiae]
MSKLFEECEWEDDLPTIGTNFRFTKTKQTKEQKKTKGKSESNNEENTNEPQTNGQHGAGWSVLLKNPKSKNAERRTASTELDEPSKSEKRKGKKRKADDVNGKRDETVDDAGSQKHQKKVKQNEIVAVNGTKKQSENSSPSEHPKSNGSEKKDKTPNAKTKPASLREKLVESLKGSRFRFINEQLYKIPGQEAKKMFQEDPASFEAYHDGYRQQVEQWPMNPLDRMIKSILKMPKDTIVADFGCGEAKLAASVPNKVYSLDLVANHNGVIACDMANTPLESNFVNVVVFCLSLMGTNLVDFLLEANRVLKVGGIMKIAEVASRFENVNEFVNNVKKCGFQLQTKDLKHKLFSFFIFKKDRTVIKGSTKIKQFSLKPCLYKKR